jgi:hypothetical protein
MIQTPDRDLPLPRHEVCFLVVPAPEIAAVDSNCDGRRGCGLARARIRTAGEREDRLGPSSAARRRAIWKVSRRTVEAFKVVPTGKKSPPARP